MFERIFNVSNLDGANGFTISGGTNFNGSFSVSFGAGPGVNRVGDINADGIDDIIFGSFVSYNLTTYAQQCTVFFGSNKGFPSKTSLVNLYTDTSKGFFFYDAAKSSQICSGNGVPSGTGDFNRDGIEDVLVGDSSSLPSNNNTGQGYVVFGSKQPFSTPFDLNNLDGSNGFILNGINPEDRSGTSVAWIKDINGDNISDLAIGAPGAAGGAGQVYIVYGSKSFLNNHFNLNSLDGKNGFIIDGVLDGVLSNEIGYSVSAAGDINGDGVGDLMIGGDTSYILFGNKNGFSEIIDLSSLTGKNGFMVRSQIDYYSPTVETAGDVNADGIGDMLFVFDYPYAQAYILYGSKNGFNATINLSDLNGTNGFVFNATFGSLSVGISATGAGDVNADGIDDIIVGTSFASAQVTDANHAYVIYGSKDRFPATINSTWINGSNGFIINGKPPEHSWDLTSCCTPVGGIGDINGDGVDDIIVSDTNAPYGEAYVIFGQKSFELPQSNVQGEISDIV